MIELKPLRDFPFKKIDLLKIDVEGAEWEVLQSLSEEQWTGLAQIVLEVHEYSQVPQARCRKIIELLSSRNFQVHVGDDFRMHDLYSAYGFDASAIANVPAPDFRITNLYAIKS